MLSSPLTQSRRLELSKASVRLRPDAELVHTVQVAAALGHAPEPAASLVELSESPAWSDSLVNCPAGGEIEGGRLTIGVADHGPASRLVQL